MRYKAYHVVDIGPLRLAVSRYVDALSGDRFIPAHVTLDCNHLYIMAFIAIPDTKFQLQNPVDS